MKNTEIDVKHHSFNQKINTYIFFSTELKQTQHLIAMQQVQLKLKNERREINLTMQHIMILRIISLVRAIALTLLHYGVRVTNDNSAGRLSLSLTHTPAIYPIPFLRQVRQSNPPPPTHTHTSQH